MPGNENSAFFCRVFLRAAVGGQLYYQVNIHQPLSHRYEPKIL